MCSITDGRLMAARKRRLPFMIANKLDGAGVATTPWAIGITRTLRPTSTASAPACHPLRRSLDKGYDYRADGRILGHFVAAHTLSPNHERGWPVGVLSPSTKGKRDGRLWRKRAGSALVFPPARRYTRKPRSRTYPPQEEMTQPVAASSPSTGSASGQILEPKRRQGKHKWCKPSG